MVAARRAVFHRRQPFRLGRSRHQAQGLRAPPRCLVFKRVLAVRSVGINQKKRDEVLSLLAIRFEQKGEGPEGSIEIDLAGGATIALDVECIEVQLADIGGAWETTSKPRHPGA
jgi:hypothetical protein